MKFSFRISMAFCIALVTLAVCAWAQTALDYDALVRQGNTQLQAGSNDAALASASAAIKVNVNRWEAYAVAGGALMNLKRYEEAADQFGQAIDHAPQAKQPGLRDLRKQCLLAEAASPPALDPAPTPAPVSASLSLADTMKFIYDKMTSDSHFAFQATRQNPANGSTEVLTLNYDLSQLVADPEGCVLSGMTSGQSFDIPLKRVQQIKIEPIEQWMTRALAVPRINVPPYKVVTSTTPPTVLMTVHWPEPTYDAAWQFDFRDAELADAVSKVLAHAVQLCGGGSIKGPANSGPSLQVTMKFIENKLNDVGPISYSFSRHYDDNDTDQADKLKTEISQVVADPRTCRVRYHLKMENDEVVVHDQDRQFSLKSVTDIAAMSSEQSEKQTEPRPTSNYKINPPVFDLLVRRAGNTFDVFNFTDETLASRVAEAMKHAVELCNSSEPEPF